MKEFHLAFLLSPFDTNLADHCNTRILSRDLHCHTIYRIHIESVSDHSEEDDIDQDESDQDDDSDGSSPSDTLMVHRFIFFAFKFMISKIFNEKILKVRLN